MAINKLHEKQLSDAGVNVAAAYRRRDLDDTFEGSLVHKFDNEYWIRFELIEKETYEISLTADGMDETTNTVLKIFNSKWEQVAANVGIDLFAGDQNLVVIITPDSSGIYYIYVSVYSNCPTKDNIGDYMLNVSAVHESDRLVDGDLEDALNGDAGE